MQGGDAASPASALAIVAAVAVAFAMVGVVRRARATSWLVALAAGAVGGAWMATGSERVALDSLARVAWETPAAWFHGVALSAPRVVERQGSMADFDPRPPRWRFELDVDSATIGDRAITVHGRVWVSMAGPPMRESTVCAGDRVAAFGQLAPFQPPRNPGEFDGAAWARASGIAGTVWVDEMAAVRTSATLARRVGGEEETDGATAAPWRAVTARLRAGARDLARGALMRGLPASMSDEHRALLRAMFLGERDAALAPLERAFQRTGTIHLVAISGFNMAVLAAASMILLRPLGGGAKPRDRAIAANRPTRGGCDSRSRRPAPSAGPARWHAWVIIAVVLLYLAAIEWQPAVLRAGAMIVVASIGAALGRHWRISGIVAAAALLLLAAGPRQLENAGFQLSFAVVGALLWLGPTLRTRLFGRHDPHASTLVAVALDRGKTAIACAAAAWLVATPLALHHFGIVSPLAAPLTLLATPLASALLAVGYLKMFVTPLAPTIGAALGWLIAPLVASFAGLMRAADGLPGAVFYVPAPGVAWTLAAIGAITVAIVARGRMALLALASLVALTAALLWPLRPWIERPPLRVDMLDVGDGTCMLVRSADAAIVFDAGGLNVAVGDRVVVPALRALGVRRLDAVVVSHPNLDHYDAVLELADAFPIDTVLLTEAFDRIEKHDPIGPVARLLEGLRARQIAATHAAAGDVRTFGAARLEWLNPGAGAHARRLNDVSQVIHVEVAGRSLLLCGDIEDEAIAAVRRRVPALRADIVELPHHGSWRDSAAEFIDGLDPAVVIQSTGPRRLHPDRWAGALAARERLVTAERGCLTVVVEEDGSITTMAWRPAPGEDRP